MNLVVLPQAADEFEDATDYYERQQPGLGRRFRDEVDRHIRWITDNPDIPRVRRGGYHRVNLKVFPYYVAYLKKHEVVWVLAIAHSRRKPKYWIKRKQEIAE